MVTKIRRADGTPAAPVASGAEPSIGRQARALDVPSLVQGYAAGKSIRTLVTETGASYGTVHARLRQAGVAMRPRGGAWRASGTSEVKPIKRAAKRAARAK